MEKLELFPSGKTKFEISKFIEFAARIQMPLSMALRLAWDEMLNTKFGNYDKSCRASMLNNLIVHYVEDVFNDIQGVKVLKISNSGKPRIVLSTDEFVVIFKKYPVCNHFSGFSNKIINQELNQHVITCSYQVNDIWSELGNVELQYRIGNVIIYRTPINLRQTEKSNLQLENKDSIVKPKFKTNVIRKAE